MGFASPAKGVNKTDPIPRLRLLAVSIYIKRGEYFLAETSQSPESTPREFCNNPTRKNPPSSLSCFNPFHSRHFLEK